MPLTTTMSLNNSKLLGTLLLNSSLLISLKNPVLHGQTSVPLRLTALSLVWLSRILQLRLTPCIGKRRSLASNSVLMKRNSGVSLTPTLHIIAVFNASMYQKMTTNGSQRQSLMNQPDGIQTLSMAKSHLVMKKTSCQLYTYSWKVQTAVTTGQNGSLKTT